MPEYADEDPIPKEEQKLIEQSNDFSADIDKSNDSSSIMEVKKQSMSLK